MIRQTHTHVDLEISKTAYEEIRKKLLDAGYNHVFDGQGPTETMDMHGIALIAEQEETTIRWCKSD